MVVLHVNAPLGRDASCAPARNSRGAALTCGRKEAPQQCSGVISFSLYRLAQHLVWAVVVLSYRVAQRREGGKADAGLPCCRLLFDTQGRGAGGRCAVVYRYRVLAASGSGPCGPVCEPPLDRLHQIQEKERKKHEKVGVCALKNAASSIVAAGQTCFGFEFRRFWGLLKGLVCPPSIWDVFCKISCSHMPPLYRPAASVYNNYNLAVLPTVLVSFLNLWSPTN